MRRTAAFLLAAIPVLAACDGRAESAAGGDRAHPSTSSAACGDAPELRQRSLDLRRESDGATGDQRRILLGAQANYLAALAIVAELECSHAHTGAAEALEAARAAAAQAEGARSFYAAAIAWDSANSAAVRAIDLMTRRDP